MSRKKLISTLAGSAVFLSLAAGPALASEKDDIKALKAYVDARLKEIEKAQQDLAKAQAELNAKAEAVAKAEAAAAARAAAPPPAPVAQAAVPEALKTDQNGNLLGVLSKPVMVYDDDKTQVHLYGLIEATISDATNQQSATNGKKSPAAIGFQTAWFSGNRWGIDADHALGFGDSIGLPGLKAISKLEGEYELPSGANDTAGAMFNRDAWLGLYSPDLGKLTFGRQNTVTRDFTQTWGDAYGTQDVTLKEGGYTNVNNFKQFIFYSGAPGGDGSGTRYDSGIVWKKKWGDHWVTGLGYEFSFKGLGGSSDPGYGGALPGNNAKDSDQAVSVAYNQLSLGSAGTISANINYDRANNDNLIHQAWLAGGDWVIGMFRFNAGYVHYTAQQGDHNSAGTRTDNSFTVSAVVTPIPKTDFALGYVDMIGHHAGLSGGGNVLNPFLGDTRGVTQTVNGSKGTLFGSVMYHADSQTDFYVAYDYMKVGGSWVVGDAQGNGASYGKGQAHNDELEVATGIRFKF
jgi:predicted porin